MIALDTNVLVRFLINDDEAQHERASAFIRSAVERDGALYVSDIVLVETVWVLSRAYRLNRQQIAEAVDQLLAARQLTFNAPEILINALNAFKTGKGGFADYLIREQANAFGCVSVATFDQDLLKEGGFIAP